MNEEDARGRIMRILTSKFKDSILWTQIEPELASHCAKLPTPTTEETKQQYVKGLAGIGKFLEEQGYTKSDIEFLTIEAERINGAQQLFTYEEESDDIPEADIEIYCGRATGTEGVIGIHKPYNIRQLKKLTDTVFRRTGQVKVYISTHVTTYGKIKAELYQGAPQRIPIARIIYSKRKNPDTDLPLISRVAYFDEKVPLKEWIIGKEVKAPFFIYQFTSAAGKEYILLSSDQLPIGDYTLTGVVTEVDDHRILTETTKLPTKLPFFLVHSAKSNIVRFTDHEQFFTWTKEKRATGRDLYLLPFCGIVESLGKKRRRVFKHPDWFRRLIWAWMLHEQKGMFRPYPLHILIIGPPHSGKTRLLDGIHANSLEMRPVFTGSNSTLKSLIPSFKYDPPRIGYLSESNRFAFCDEFLRCLVKTRDSNTNRQEREESVGAMNDLLEHQKREMGSGVSTLNITMRARILATTNPVRGINSVEDLLSGIDHSFLSRWLIYYQKEDGEHVKMVKGSDDFDLELHEYELADNDFVSIIDYLQSFPAEYDMKIVKEIYEETKPILSESLLSHYESRHKHHIECLMDGIIKTRCLLRGEPSFAATEQDYATLRMVWGAVITSWVDPEAIKRMPIQYRIHYLPEGAQWLYKQILKEKRPVPHDELRALSEAGMKKYEYIAAIVILKEMGVIRERDGCFVTHWSNDEGLLNYVDGETERI